MLLSPLYMCPHTALWLSSYYYIRVRIRRVLRMLLSPMRFVAGLPIHVVRAVLGGGGEAAAAQQSHSGGAGQEQARQGGRGGFFLYKIFFV